MKKSITLLFLIIGIALSILSIYKLIKFELPLIIGCFAISFISFYISIHKRNKEARRGYG
jgi:uncharacterized membrane protein